MSIRWSKHILTACLLLFVAVGVLAAGPVAAQPDFGTQIVEDNIALSGQDIRVTIVRIINITLGILGVVAVGIILYGGFIWMTSGGNQENVARARRIITNGLIGLLIIVVSWSIVRFIFGVLTDATGYGTESCNYEASPPPQTCALGGGCTGIRECQPSNTWGGCQSDPLAPCSGNWWEQFWVDRFSPQGATPIRNVVHRTFFTYSPDPDTVTSDNYQVVNMSHLLQLRVTDIASGNAIIISPADFDEALHQTIDGEEPFFDPADLSFGSINQAADDEPSRLVDGDIVVNGRTVSFTPDAPCPAPHTDRQCFDRDSLYGVVVFDGSSGIEGNAGSRGSRTLLCSEDHPCWSYFQTGTLIDVDDPTIRIEDPYNGQRVTAEQWDTEIITTVSDDTGISHVVYTVYENDGSTQRYIQYDVDSELNTIPLEPESDALAYIDDSPVVTGTGGEVTYQSTGLWDVFDFTFTTPPPARVKLQAEAFDFDGNSTRSNQVTVVVQPPFCANGLLDDEAPALESAVDCGGPWCGACSGQSCDVSADDDMCTPNIYGCAAGNFCNADSCVCDPLPIITGLSPEDGAPGNFLTISGSNFGTITGSVAYTFKDQNTNELITDPLTDEPIRQVAQPLGSLDQCDDVWQNNQVIVLTPDPLAAGIDIDTPVLVEVELTTAGGLTDTTDDALGYGGEFVPTDRNYPGICTVDPNRQAAQLPVEIVGKGFSDTPGQPTDVTFGGVAAQALGAWSDQSIAATLPNLGDGVVTTTVSVGGEISNGYAITVDADAFATGPFITQVDPSQGGIGQYVTLTGRNFGGEAGIVYFIGADGVEYPADVDFPAMCQQHYWQHDRVVVKVPSGVSTGDFTIQLERDDDAGARSNEAAFSVTTAPPTPGVCRIDPDNGPIDTPVYLYGESFGPLGVQSKVKFWPHDDETAHGPLLDWGTVVKSSVPGGAADGVGPVQLVSNDGVRSNNIDFNVGSCQSDNACNNKPADDSCTVVADGQPDESGCWTCGVAADSGYEWQWNTSCGEQPPQLQCCGNGVCAINCGIGEGQPSSYAWAFSTSPVPAFPEVIEQFDLSLSCHAGQNLPSPSPWTPRWDDARGQERACVNSVITARFTIPMLENSFSVGATGAVLIEQCGVGDGGVVCEGTDLLEGSMELLSTEGEPGVSGFIFTPTINFTTNTWYQVTLRGTSAVAQCADGIDNDGDGDIDDADGDCSGDATDDSESTAGYQSQTTQALYATNGYPLQEDYSWRFRTRADATLCSIGCAEVEPISYTAQYLGLLYRDYTDPFNPQGPVYHRALASTDDNACIFLDSADYAWQWDARTITGGPGTAETVFVNLQEVPNAESQCDDGFDNDNDGDTDQADFGCVSETDRSEADGDQTSAAASHLRHTEALRETFYAAYACDCDRPAACSDGFDNDGDEAIDGADDSCVSPTDDDEEQANFQLKPATSQTVYVGSEDVCPARCAEFGRTYAHVGGNPIFAPPVRIFATEPVSGQFDHGNLFINLADPKVIAQWPDCDFACINAQIGAAFNTAMLDSIDTSELVQLYSCGADETCAPGSMFPVEITFDVAGQNLGYRYTSDPPTGQYNSELTFLPASSHNNGTLLPNTHYRVVFDGQMHSLGGVVDGAQIVGAPLTDLNYDANDDGEIDSYSWTFKVKDDFNLCAIDRVSVSPSRASLYLIGAQQVFTSQAFGQPDQCSANGQRLNNSLYRWDWRSTDPTVATVAPLQSVCGDGYKGLGEDCDDGNTLSGDGCSASCLYEGSADSTGPGFCRDGLRGVGEECDLGLIDPTCRAELAAGADSCISILPAVWNAYNCDPNTCLRTGADHTAPQAVCGNGIVEDGEDCDDRNVVPGDGCDQQCVAEGSVAGQALCGDGLVGVGENCETCSNATGGTTTIFGGGCRGEYPRSDQGNPVGGDGCSTSCLYEELSNPGNRNYTIIDIETNRFIPDAVCGNGVIEYGEDCEGQVGDNTDGCSDQCLHTGATNEIFDGPITAATANDEGQTRITAEAGGICVGNPSLAGQSCVVNGDCPGGSCDTSASRQGSADLSVICGFTDEAQCPAEGYGLDSNGCCRPKPIVAAAYPHADDPTGPICRNTAISVTFGPGLGETDFVEGMEAVTFDNANVFVQFFNGAASCPDGRAETLVRTGDEQLSDGPFFVRWFGQLTQWVVDRLRQTALAQILPTPPTADRWCFLNYDVITQSNKQFVVQLSEPLPANTQIRVAVFDDIRTPRGVSFNTDPSSMTAPAPATAQPVTIEERDALAWTFTSGADLCLLDYVTLNPTQHAFTEFDETVDFTATAHSQADGQLITPIAGTYEWQWGWAISNPTIARQDSFCAGDESCLTVQTTNVNGEGTLIATADVTVDQEALPGVIGESFSAQADLVSFMCQNPWPKVCVHKDNGTTTPSDPNNFVCQVDGDCYGSYACEFDPNAFSDSAKSQVEDIQNGSPGSLTNFRTYYCRDSGQAGTFCADGTACQTDVDCGGTVGSCRPNFSDDLPALQFPPFFTQPQPANTVRHLLLPRATAVTLRGAELQGSDDAILVSVEPNPQHLSPSLWFAQRFGGTATPIEVDGYRGVQSGSTIYMNGGNYSDAEEKLYTNIYILSHNDDANPATRNIFEQLIDNFSLNVNVIPVHGQGSEVCLKGGSPILDASGQPISCSSDFDCYRCSPNINEANPDPSTLCESNADCAALGQQCDKGTTTETVYCDNPKAKIQRNVRRAADIHDMRAALDSYFRQFGTYPQLDAGSYIAGRSFSTWPSWQASLGNELGSGLAVDPLNQFNGCVEPFNSATCWDEVDLSFMCPDRSYAYLYAYQPDEQRGRILVNWENIFIDKSIDQLWQESDFEEINQDFHTIIGEACQNLSGYSINDADQDGVPDFADNCVLTYNPRACAIGGNACTSDDDCTIGSCEAQVDADADGVGDACDFCVNDPNNDSDGDRICGGVDNCPLTANPLQADTDEDEIGDACDVDCWGADEDECRQRCETVSMCQLAPFTSCTWNELGGQSNCCGDDPGEGPGNTEICWDGIDNNCNGLIDELNDEDGDGYGTCGAPADCKDNDPNVFPGNIEQCDGIDNNCDGEVDEGCVDVAIELAHIGPGAGHPAGGDVVEVYLDSLEPDSLIATLDEAVEASVDLPKLQGGTDHTIFWKVTESYDSAANFGIKFNDMSVVSFDEANNLEVDYIGSVGKAGYTWDSSEPNFFENNSDIVQQQLLPVNAYLEATIDEGDSACNAGNGLVTFINGLAAGTGCGSRLQMRATIETFCSNTVIINLLGLQDFCANSDVAVDFIFNACREAEDSGGLPPICSGPGNTEFFDSRFVDNTCGFGGNQQCWHDVLLSTQGSLVGTVAEFTFTVGEESSSSPFSPFTGPFTGPRIR